jgi:hypothetical protein
MSAIGNAIGSLVGDITGSSQQAQAAQSAAQTQANAANYAADLQNKQFQQIQQNLSPYMNIGTQALPQYLSLLGLGSQGGAGMQSALENMPGYQFALQQGLKSAANSASGSGLNLSGAQQKGLANYATGLASTNYQNLLSNLQNAVATGQNAAAGLGSAGMTNAQQLGNYATQAANATAAGQIAGGNTQANALNSLMQLGLGGTGIYSLGKNAGLFNLAGGGGGTGMGQLSGLYGLSNSVIPEATFNGAGADLVSMVGGSDMASLLGLL